MKKIFLLFFGLALVSTACTWDSVDELTEQPNPDPDPDPEPTDPCVEITFSGTVKPIIEANCAITGCHGNRQSPLFTNDDQIIAAASRIKARTGAGTMPPSGPLSATDIEAIACWVDAGAPNN